jgi:hypothetical protein
VCFETPGRARVRPSPVCPAGVCVAAGRGAAGGAGSGPAPGCVRSPVPRPLPAHPGAAAAAPCRAPSPPAPRPLPASPSASPHELAPRAPARPRARPVPGRPPRRRAAVAGGGRRAGRPPPMIRKRPDPGQHPRRRKPSAAARIAPDHQITACEQPWTTFGPRAARVARHSTANPPHPRRAATGPGPHPGSLLPFCRTPPLGPSISSPAPGFPPPAAVASGAIGYVTHAPAPSFAPRARRRGQGAAAAAP